jgi:hypothetical protein
MDKNKIAVALFDKLAQVYQEKYMDVALYRTLDWFCENLQTPNARILELACGPAILPDVCWSNAPILKSSVPTCRPRWLNWPQSTTQPPSLN